jgi:hypothetical protein
MPIDMLIDRMSVELFPKEGASYERQFAQKGAQSLTPCLWNLRALI